MTESQYTSQLLKALRQRLPQAVALKLSDRFTDGIPDFFVSYNGVTTWFEAKKINNALFSEMTNTGTIRKDFFVELVPKKHVPAIQWETLRRLRRGYVVIYTDKGHGLVYVQCQRWMVERQQVKLLTMSDLLFAVIEAAQQ